jgi:hypothetical protein
MPATPATETSGEFHVVILYDRLAFVGRAMATYLHLLRDLAEDFTPDYRLWRIDAVLAPEHAAEAERDIAAAEVIIVAVNGRGPCPLPFHQWRRGAGHDGGRPPHAIIALMDASGESAAAARGSWSSVLRGSATQIHSEVFVCDLPGSGVVIVPPPGTFARHVIPAARRARPDPLPGARPPVVRREPPPPSTTTP